MQIDVMRDVNRKLAKELHEFKKDGTVVTRGSGESDTVSTTGEAIEYQLSESSKDDGGVISGTVQGDASSIAGSELSEGVTENLSFSELVDGMEDRFADVNADSYSGEAAKA